MTPMTVTQGIKSVTFTGAQFVNFTSTNGTSGPIGRGRYISGTYGIYQTWNCEDTGYRDDLGYCTYRIPFVDTNVILRIEADYTCEYSGLSGMQPLLRITGEYGAPYYQYNTEPRRYDMIYIHGNDSLAGCPSYIVIRGSLYGMLTGHITLRTVTIWYI